MTSPLRNMDLVAAACLCGNCGADDSQVKDSRPIDGSIRRRRICTVCGNRWTTYEMHQDSLIDLREFRPSEADLLRQLADKIEKAREAQRRGRRANYDLPHGAV